jgi:hypothetical protein
MKISCTIQFIGSSARWLTLLGCFDTVEEAGGNRYLGSDQRHGKRQILL